MSKKYLIGFQTGPYSSRTQLLCEIEDIKVGDYVVAPAGLGDSAGRVMSVKPYVEGQNMSFKKLKKVSRRASGKEIAEMEEVFNQKSNAEDDEQDPFEAALSKYCGNSVKKNDEETEQPKDEDGSNKLRFILIILAVLAYMYYDKILVLFE